jgi:hypothetical protein
MGNYNPDSPILLGEQWVPIRDAQLELSPATNFVESGHSFTLATSRVLQDGRYYIDKPTDIPADADRGQHMGIAIYPAGSEALSGPIRRVVVPVSSAFCTGGTPSGDVTGRFLTPSSFSGGVSFSAASATEMGVRFSFDVSAFPQLNGKRILGINLLYVASGSDSLIGPGTAQLGGTQIAMSTEFGPVPTTNYIIYNRIRGTNSDLSITRAPLGEINSFWTSTSPTATTERQHWTYTQMLRLDTSGALPLIFITMATGTSVGGGAPTGSSLFLLYAALEVLYCEETRVAFGAVQLGTGLVDLGQKSRIGANIIPLRTMASAANPVLAAGTYTAVLTSPFVGEQGFSTAAISDYPRLNALQQLYPISSHPGVQVNIPFPMDETAVGKTLTSETIQVLPQLSLHTSGGTLTEPHVYGRQAVAQVYGSITATQEILDSVIGTNRPFPWVRWYARRFGNTTVDLRLDSTSPTVSGSGIAVTLTPAEWDALPEIIDGWKEITKRFPTATPPSMGTGMTPTWRWSATGETAGNRWEILGAVAPAVSGIASNIFNLVTPSTQRLDTATYGAPSSGSTVNLGWITGYAPPVTATTDDTSSDGVLIFSQDMPPVSGFTVSQLTQAVSGIGQDCGLDPCCIPTGIFYNRLTWTLGSTGSSSSWFYELQRMDTVDTDWQTIMMAGPTVSGFNDYESRPGLLTSYRIREINSYGFYGDWSSMQTITMTSPGITGGCVADGHVLIFTTNEVQDGSSNLAYASVWEDRIEENFSFAEAGFTVLQAMYDRDFFVAFKPLERGGEQFSREILVQAAAISPPTLGDFRSLRDMAWDNVSYICVRDEDGNKWLANVNVPTGRVVFYRRIYRAQVQIIEVTATSSQVVL